MTKPKKRDEAVKLPARKTARKPAKPKVPAPAVLPDLIVNSLTVRSEDGKTALRVGISGDAVGLWIEGKGQCLAVVASHGVQPAICFYEKEHPTAPTISLTMDEDGRPLLFVSPPGRSGDVRVIHLSPLLEGIR